MLPSTQAGKLSSVQSLASLHRARNGAPPSWGTCSHVPCVAVACRVLRTSPADFASVLVLPITTHLLVPPASMPPPGTYRFPFVHMKDKATYMQSDTKKYDAEATRCAGLVCGSEGCSIDGRARAQLTAGHLSSRVRSLLPPVRVDTL